MSNAELNAPVAGIIGGTGFSESLDAIYGAPLEEIPTETPYGIANVWIYRDGSGRKIAFISRHGRLHSVPPHKINHRANIHALWMLGVRSVFATAAVGGLRPDLRPGDLMVVDDFLDLRGGEPTTFFDEPGNVRHTDFSEPFSSALRAKLIEEAGALSADWESPPRVHTRGTYLCLAGPRYETPAEVRLFGSWGADIVGMTAAAEAVLARERELQYACVAVVTNLGTGLAKTALSHEEVAVQMEIGRPFLIGLLARTIATLADSY